MAVFSFAIEVDNLVQAVKNPKRRPNKLRELLQVDLQKRNNALSPIDLMIASGRDELSI